MRETFAILFYLKKGKKKKGESNPPTEATIYCRLSVCGTQSPFSTLLKIEPGYWNQTSKRAEGKGQNISKVNKSLARLETEIWLHYDKIKARRKKFSAEYLRDWVLGKYNNKENATVIDYFDTYIERLNKRVEIKDLTKETRDRYILVRNRFQEFLKEERNIDNIYLDEVDNDLAYDFYLYIRRTTGCQNNNAQKHVQKIHTVMKCAWVNHYISADPLAQYAIYFEKHQRTCLTWHELKRIMSKKFYSHRLEKVRDIFVFCCFTGLSYGDAKALTEDNFELKNDDREWIDKNRNKTSVNAQILFSAIPHMIIEKYKNERVKKRLLPFNSNQKMNDYVKEIAALCNVNKHLTTHVARHTFATTVTLNEGVPLETVSKMLGHTNTVTTQIYAKIVNEKLRQDAGEWNKKMAGIEAEFNLQNQ